MAKAYAKDKDIDMTQGRCCCKCGNEKGAKCIHAIDMIFIPNLPRWLFAIWAIIDKNKFPLYARMRLLSCWFFWVVSLLSIIGYSSYQLSINEDIETYMIINSLLVITGIISCFIVDIHYTRVIIYYAKGHN